MRPPARPCRCRAACAATHQRGLGRVALPARRRAVAVATRVVAQGRGAQRLALHRPGQRLARAPSGWPPAPAASSACIRFCVSVPVLSEQMVVTEPSVSTDGRRRTSACTATMRRAPSASSTVTTAGSASGIAATARLMAVSTISSGGSPRSTPDDKDHRADAEHRQRQPLAERGQAPLQRRAAVFAGRAARRPCPARWPCRWPPPGRGRGHAWRWCP